MLSKLYKNKKTLSCCASQDTRPRLPYLTTQYSGVAIFIMKQQLIILAFALVVLVVRPAVAGNNDGPPGTNGQHVTYDCGGDPMGCQNMCYYYYCLGRSNYLYVHTSIRLLGHSRLTILEHTLVTPTKTKLPERKSRRTVAEAVIDGEFLVSREGQIMGSTSFRMPIPHRTNTHQHPPLRAVKVRLW